MTILLILAIIIASIAIATPTSDPYEKMCLDELAWDADLQEFYIADPALDNCE